MSKFIVFEGIDKSGKTTQIAEIEKWLTEKGANVIRLVEPGYTKLGSELRKLLKDKSIACCKEAQEYMFMAARAQLITEQIKPALIDHPDDRTIVLCDRYVLSTLCYQVIPSALESDFGRMCMKENAPRFLRSTCYKQYKSEFDKFCARLGLMDDFYESFLKDNVKPHLARKLIRMPDLNLVFDIDFETWKKRSIELGESPDRFESQEEYIKQVIENYRFVCDFTASQEHDKDERTQIDIFGHCEIIDASLPKSFVTAAVKEAILRTIFK